MEIVNFPRKSKHPTPREVSPPKVLYEPGYFPVRDANGNLIKDADENLAVAPCLLTWLMPPCAGVYFLVGVERASVSA